MKEKIKKKLVSIEELEKTSGIKINKISRLIRQKLLPYEKEINGIRYFDKSSSLKRLKEIEKLEKQGFTVKEMREHFQKKSAPAMIFEDNEVSFKRVKNMEGKVIHKRTNV